MEKAPGGILQLLGPPGCGKTTLCNELLEALSPRSTLVIDASPNYGLTRMLCGLKPEQPIPKTVWDALSPLQERVSLPAETVDWLFQNLPQPVGEQVELLVLGPMPDQLSAMMHFPVLHHPMLQALMTYGLPRILPQYEVILVDGLHHGVHRILPDTVMRSMVVLTPEIARRLNTTTLEGSHALKAFCDWMQEVANPSLLLNQVKPGEGWKSLPDGLQQYFNRHGVRLLGKLPLIEKPEDAFITPETVGLLNKEALEGVCHEKLSRAVRELLLRLDLPLRA